MHPLRFYCYDGVVDFPATVPSIKAIAVALSRECRYAGAGIDWWPVALHSFVVADLLPDELKLYGLLHDAAECVTGDIPKPAKTEDIHTLETELLAMIFNRYDVPLASVEQDKIVYLADRHALYGEVWTVGTASLRQVYPYDKKAARLVKHYQAQYPVEACVDPNGACVQEFIKRFVLYGGRG